MSEEDVKNRILERREALQRELSPERIEPPFDPASLKGPGPMVCLSPARDWSREPPARRSWAPTLIALAIGLLMAALVSYLLLR